jgi:hypothetical protein
MQGSAQQVGKASSTVRAQCQDGDVSVIRRAWWLVPEVAAVAVLAVLLATAPVPPSPAELRAQLTARVIAALESASPAEHHDHGHDITAEDRVACVAEVYGTDPPDAATVAQARTVYAQYFCAAGPPGTRFELSAFSSGPCAVRLSNPPVVVIPRSGMGYPERVRELVPDRYEEQALKGFQDPSVPDALRPKFEALMAGPSTGATSGDG